MCKALLEGGAPGLHFYTLNLEKVVVGILKGLGKISDAQAAAFQAVEADAKFMVSAQGITTGTKANGNRPALPGNRPLVEADPAMHELVQQEKARQMRCIELIASENFVSEAVLEAMVSLETATTVATR